MNLALTNPAKSFRVRAFSSIPPIKRTYTSSTRTASVATGSGEDIDDDERCHCNRQNVMEPIWQLYDANVRYRGSRKQDKRTMWTRRGGDPLT